MYTRLHRYEGAMRADGEVYVYFNNDPEGAAVKNALELKELVK